MTTTHILGDNVSRKSNFDPDLAKKLTKYYEEHPEELEKQVVLPNSTLPASNASDQLERIHGNYLKAIQAAIPETIQTSAELQKARVELNARKDYSLNTLIFFTANVPLYGVEKGKPFLLFGERKAFLRLYMPHINEVYEKILSGQNRVYTLPDADKTWSLNESISSGALTRFDLAELIENEENQQRGYFTINVKKAAQLKGAKRELAELINGKKNDYIETFKRIEESGISKAKIWLLIPDYVKSMAEDNLIGRVSRLYGFYGDSFFSAGAHCVGITDSIRGVRRRGRR